MTNPAGQRWTRRKPTEPGWYWFRWDKDRDAIIVVVSIEDCDWRVLEMGNTYSGAFAGYTSGEFQGPLTPNEATE
jgi:hypothetical protein